MRVLNILTLLAFLFTLPACQTTDLNKESDALQSNPRDTTAELDLGKRYYWGGEILEIVNLQNSSELTILAYPLDRNGYPKFDDASVGRFIAVHQGFLEPTDYSEGTLIAVTGTLSEYRRRKISDADYNFPVLDVEKSSLKNKRHRNYHLPFSIGIGISL